MTLKSHVICPYCWALFPLPGIPQAKRGDIWWFLVEQHCLKYPSIEEKTPKVDYTELLKQLTTHQHAILIDLGR